MSVQECAALARADAFAAAVLSRVAPLTFGVARSSDELEAVYRLRYAVVIDQGWGKAEDFPDASERDVFDERAIQVVALDAERLVGTTRLVPPVPGDVLPTEQAFGLAISASGRVIDMGRTCRAPWCDDARQRILWGLLCQAWIELRARGFAEICGIFSLSMIRFYRRMGFRVEILAGARSHWGQDRHPVLIRPAEWIDEVRVASIPSQ